MSEKPKSGSKSDPHADFHTGSELIEPETQGQVDVALLQKTLEEAQEEAKNNWEKLLRKEAELQNIQRRAATDLDNARKFGTERMAQELLAVVDSFEQALLYEENNQQNTAMHDGTKLTYTMLLSVLAKFGIKEINPAAGEAFNPQCHEAISIQETADMAPNHIIALAQKGYFIHERVLRAARVVVSRAPSESAE